MSLIRAGLGHGLPTLTAKNAVRMGHGASVGARRLGNLGGSEHLWDGMEGDAGGGGFEGGQHGCRGERAHAVFVVEQVHHFGELGAALLAVKVVEEVERVEMVGDQVVEGNADEIGTVEVASCGFRGPEPAESGDQGLTVLHFAEADFSLPAAGGDTIAADLRDFAAGQNEAEVDADGACPEPVLRRRMAALWSSLWATAQAFSLVRMSGPRTCW